MNWIDAAQALHWLPPINPRVKGVGQLDWGQVMAMLNARFSWDVTRTTSQAWKKPPIRSSLQTTADRSGQEVGEHPSQTLTPGAL